MTDAERERLTILVKEMRQVAQRVGPMHAYWDTISDVELLLQDGNAKPLLDISPAEWIELIEGVLPTQEKGKDRA